jgi:multidrug efflux pump subunit AcrB
MDRIGRALYEIDAEYRSENGGQPLLRNQFAYSSSITEGFMLAELVLAEDRDMSTKEVTRLWRDRVGPVPGTEVLSFYSENGPSFGSDISFDLAHPNWESLKAASLELENKLKDYYGLYDIQSSVSSVSNEFHIDIKPEAEALGITRFDLGSQLRHAFYGAEAQRIQRGTHEIKVLVRYPREDRRTTATLDTMFIRTPGGDSVPFDSVAALDVKPGFNQTTRIDFKRAVEVTAEAETEKVEPGRIKAELVNEFLPELMKKYPGLTWATSGMSEEEEKMAKSLAIGFALAMFAIYSLLAIPTRSYLQPLIIMGVIPFGIIGAVLGHMVTGYAISMMSLMGIIALSGVVVNDSLIMVDFVNRQVREGVARREAAVQAGVRRFRAIILTSLTTFCALVPMLLERSTQAQVIIPMAISLAFGIVFATVITLLLVPSLYVILEDLSKLFGGGEEAAEEAKGIPGETRHTPAA